MESNLDISLEKTNNVCFYCNKEFSLYKIQELPMPTCGICINFINGKHLIDINTSFSFMKKIIEFTKENKISINGKDAIFIDELVEYLQK